jgi:hypothetical protein
VNIPKDGETKQPSIKLSILANENNVDKFLEVYDWVVDLILKT